MEIKIGSSPIVVAFGMQPFSTSMIVGERAFGFLQTVPPYEKDRALRSIIL